MDKIIIIGAGIIGMLSARLFAQAGCQVTIIEQGYAGKESSWAGGGIISPLYPWRYEAPVSSLAKWSQGEYPQLLKEVFEQTGVDPEYQSTGMLYLDIEDEVDKAKAWMQQYGYGFEALNQEQLLKVEPSINPHSQSGWYSEEIGQVRNPRLVRAFQRSLELTENIELQQNTQVTDFIVKNNTAIGVKTNQGDYYGDKIIIAGGAWSAKLLDGLINVPRIAPVKGQMIVFKAPENLVSRMVLSKGRYIIPRKDGHVLLGSTLEFKDFDKTTSDETLSELRDEAIRIIPALSEYPIEKQWAGLRPGSIDGVPYIGEHPQLSNLYLNAGHFRNGVVIGYASCELLKNLILGETPILDPSPYALSEERLLGSSQDIDLQGAI